jgi:hypothetical protein
MGRGIPMPNDAAVAAARWSVHEPYVVNGKAVAVAIVETIAFHSKE